MSKPKIAFVIPSFSSGGAERVVSNLANFLITEYEVHIITLNKTEPFYPLDNKIVLHHCVDDIKPSNSIFTAIKSNWFLTKTIAEIVKTNKIQLLIGFMTTSNILSIISGRLLQIPVIISERNNPSKESTPRIWRILRRLIYRFANYTVVQTEPIKQYYNKSIQESRLTIIPNPIYMDLSMKNIIGNGDSEKIILNVGRLSPQKAQDILIKAFAKTDNNGWKLIIAGEGEDRSKLEGLINELEIQHKIELAGRIKNISDMYSRAKIFAFSSLYEGFPNALIEAMYFGLPCISTDCPTGPSELISNGENGFLVPMNDVDSMADKLGILMNDMDQRKLFGERAQKTVEIFKVKNVIKQWKKIIDECLNTTT